MKKDEELKLLKKRMELLESSEAERLSVEETFSMEGLSDEKTGAEALRLTEEQFRKAINDAPTPIMIHAEDGEVVLVNKIWTELTGFSHSDIPTITEWTSKAYGQRMDDARSIIDAVFERNAVAHDGEFSIKIKSGNTRIWDFSSGPLGRLPDGSRLVISMATDITERKSAEATILEQAAFVNKNPYPVLRIDFDGIIRYANNAAKNESNKTIEGQSIFTLFNGLGKSFLTELPSEIPVKIEQIIGEKTFLFTFIKDFEKGTIFIYSNDITELLSAEQAGKRAEETLHQYAHIVSSSTDMMALLNKKYIYNAANKAYLEVFNLTSEQLIGHTVSEVFGEEFFNTIIKPNADRCLAGEEIHYQEWFNFPATGKRYLDISYFPYIDAENTVRGFVVNGRDITERKQAEEDIKESEGQFQNLFNSMREGFALCEVICNEKRIPIDYRFLKINPAFGEQSGMDVASSVGKTIKEIYPTIESRWIERYGRVAITQEAIHFEDYNKNSNKYYDAMAFSPSKGKFAMLFKDITQRRKAEKALLETHEKLKLSIDNMPNAYILTDTEILVLEWNGAAEKIFGYSREEILGKNLIDFVVPEKVRNQVGEVVKKLKVGVVADHSEKDNNIRKDGKLISCQWFNTPLADKTGKVFGILFMAQDVTERMQAEEVLKRSEFLLNKSQRVARVGSYKLDFNAGTWEGSETLDDIFGIDKNYEKNIDGWLQIVHPGDRVDMRYYLSNHDIAERQPFNKEYRIVRVSDKDERWVHGIGEVEFDKDGRLDKMFGTVQDITHQKNLEMELKSLNYELEKKVSERTKELDEKVSDLERFYNATVDRELRMKGLMETIEKLEKKLEVNNT